MGKKYKLRNTTLLQEYTKVLNSRTVGEKCLAVYVHDVLEEREKEVERQGEQEEGEELRSWRAKKEGGRGYDNITGYIWDTSHHEVKLK